MGERKSAARRAVVYAAAGCGAAVAWLLLASGPAHAGEGRDPGAVSPLVGTAGELARTTVRDVTGAARTTTSEAPVGRDAVDRVATRVEAATRSATETVERAARVVDQVADHVHVPTAPEPVAPEPEPSPPDEEPVLLADQSTSAPDDERGQSDARRAAEVSRPSGDVRRGHRLSTTRAVAPEPAAEADRVPEPPADHLPWSAATWDGPDPGSSGSPTGAGPVPVMLQGGVVTPTGVDPGHSVDHSRAPVPPVLVPDVSPD